MPNKYQKSRAKQRARAQSKINRQQVLLEELKLRYSRKDRSPKLLERVNGKVRYTERYYKMIDAYEADQDYTSADTVKAIIAEHKKAMEMDPELESLSERSVYSRVQRT